MSTGSSRSPTILGERYQLLELLGRGGMGEVWCARDRRLDRLVAVKLLRPAGGLDEGARARFTAEARAAARLNHANVVTVYDSGDHAGIPFLVMELLPGRTLADDIREGPLSEARAKALTLDVLAALDASHAAGILHRDIKPANVLLTGDGTARLADFGIAKSLHAEDVTATGIVLGTTAYLAPERFAGGAATERSDLYAVGALLYEALSGRKPFEADAPLALLHAIQEQSPPSLPDQRLDLDPQVVAAVERALEKDPAKRFSSAAEMAHALGAARPASTGRPRRNPDLSGTTRPLTMTAERATNELAPGSSTARMGTTSAHLTDEPLPRTIHQPEVRARWAQHPAVLIAGAVGVAGLLLLLTFTLLRSSPSTNPPSTTSPSATASTLPEALDDALTELEETVSS